MPGKPGRPRKNKNHRTTTMRQKLEKTESKSNNNNDNRNPTINSSQASLTPEQQAIVSRVRAESPDWEPISEEAMHDFSLAVSPLDLQHNFPEAYKEQVEKRFAFHWCERTDRAIDIRTNGGSPVTRWKICTRSTTPFLAKYVDPTIGCIARLDVILLFRPWERHMIEKRAKEGIAEARANSGKPENVALKRASDNIEAYSGPQYKIGSSDDVQYEDSRQDALSDDLGDLVVE